MRTQPDPCYCEIADRETFVCVGAAREARDMLNLPGNEDHDDGEAGPLLGIPRDAGSHSRHTGAEPQTMDRGGGVAKPPQTQPTTF